MAETVPDSKNKVQALTISNSSHVDQGDMCMYSGWEVTMMNSLMFKTKSGYKKEGTQTEFHEFLCCLWLEYLLKIGYHDNTFTMDHIIGRIEQF